MFSVVTLVGSVCDFLNESSKFGQCVVIGVCDTVTVSCVFMACC